MPKITFFFILGGFEAFYFSSWLFAKGGASENFALPSGGGTENFGPPAGGGTKNFGPPRTKIPGPPGHKFCHFPKVTFTRSRIGDELTRIYYFQVFLCVWEQSYLNPIAFECIWVNSRQFVKVHTHLKIRVRFLKLLKITRAKMNASAIESDARYKRK